jgi:hypothetical protein
MTRRPDEKTVLGFVTCHFLSENTIEEVSEVTIVASTQVGENEKPDA